MREAVMDNIEISTEIKFRIKRTQQHLCELGIDYYLSCHPDDIYYLANFSFFIHERIFMLIIPAKGKPLLVVPKIEEINVTRNSIGDIDVVTYQEFPAIPGHRWSDVVNDIISTDSQCGVSPEMQISLTNQLNCNYFVCDIIEKMRMVKSIFEINRIKYTCEVISAAHQMLLNIIPQNLTIVEMYSQVSQYCMQRALAEVTDLKLLTTKIDGVILPNKFSHSPHEFDNALCKATSKGPHTTVISGRINGYAAEVERTFFIDRVDDKHLRYFDNMIEARALAFTRVLTFSRYSLKICNT
jgi:Xaa-Pro dipeptidase